MTLQEQRLASFVDRTEELSRFCNLIEDDGKCVYVVWGSSGIGKTSLLARMVHECSHRKLRKAEIVWTDTRPHDYLAIMRKIRDDAGADAFTTFTDLINFYTVPRYELKIVYEGSNISVGTQMQTNDSSIGTMAGIVVKDVMLNAPRSDMAVPEAERMARLTDRFVDNLAEATAHERFVVFFDAIEKMSADTEKWIWCELIGAASSGRLPNVRFVLCGQKKPELSEWRLFVEEAQLQPLGAPHIIEYLAKRGVDEIYREVLAGTLLEATHGKLSDIANLVEGILSRQKKQSLERLEK